VPIRERFEIADIAAWGQLPFLALPDEKHRLYMRWRGAWSDAGSRQMESIQGWPRNYYVWRWRNPSPTLALTSIELVPRQANVIVAAITLGLVDEDPLTHPGAVPVRVDLKSAELVSRPLDVGPNDVALAVDRGVAGYTYPLSRQSAEAFLDDAFAGWGEAANGASSPVYAGVAAVPSATLEIRIDDELLESVRWQDVLESQAVETDRIRVAVGRGRAQLGRDQCCRRRHWSARAVSRALPLRRWRPLPAPRAPLPRGIQSQHLAPRRGRRSATRATQLCVYRWALPGLAAARRGARRRRSGRADDRPAPAHWHPQRRLPARA
jgi:hypothetical protein